MSLPVAPRQDSWAASCSCSPEFSWILRLLFQFCVAGLSALHGKERWFFTRHSVMMTPRARSLCSLVLTPLQKNVIFVASSHSACGSQSKHYEGEKQVDAGLQMSGRTHLRSRRSALVPGEYRKERRFPSPLPVHPPPPACVPERQKTGYVTDGAFSSKSRSPTVVSNTSGACKHLSNGPF